VKNLRVAGPACEDERLELRINPSKPRLLSTSLETMASGSEVEKMAGKEKDNREVVLIQPQAWKH
jgi:hypothetical protein